MNDDKIIIDSQTAYLMPRTGTSVFESINAKVLGNEPRRLGSGKNAVATMLANGDELRVLMPRILSLDPRSLTNNWDAKVADYWNSLSVDVVPQGVKLEIGFKYDINDDISILNKTRKDYINDLIKRVPTIKTSKDLMEYVKGLDTNGTPNVREEEKWKYAEPINAQDYLLWRYCLVFREVANDVELVNKSGHIRFYLYDEVKANAEKKRKFVTERKASEVLSKILAEQDAVDNMLFTLRVDVEGKDSIDKGMLLQEYSKREPEKFIALANDKALSNKAMIERYINAGLLKRLPNTDVIVDAGQPDIVLGNTINEAITYMNNDVNKVQVNQYAARFKGLKK